MRNVIEAIHDANAQRQLDVVLSAAKDLAERPEHS
jgi:hypothetical protein